MIASYSNPSAEGQLNYKEACIQLRNNPTEDAMREIITKYPFLIQILENPPESIQHIAVSQTPSLILHINGIIYPSTYLVAIQTDGYILKCISKDLQTEQIVLEAVKQTRRAIQFIKIPLTDNLIAEITLLELMGR